MEQQTEKSRLQRYPLIQHQMKSIYDYHFTRAHLYSYVIVTRVPSLNKCASLLYLSEDSIIGFKDHSSEMFRD